MERLLAGTIALYIVLHLAVLLRPPLYKSGTCLVENISGAVLRITDITDGKYSYTVSQFGMQIEEIATIDELESANTRKCEEDIL